MMKITRINRISKHRIFDDYSWPANLIDFAQFNLIYGWNGSGKTTLSNIFRSLMTREDLLEGDVDFQIDKTSIKRSNLKEAALPQIRVFNHKFVGSAIFESSTAHLAPIYFLGEDSAEKQRKIEELRATQKTLFGSLAKHQLLHRSALAEYEEYCSSRARIIKELLTAPGSKYNNYDKRDLKEAADKLTQPGANNTPTDEATRTKLKKSANGRSLDRVSRMSITYPDLASLTNSTKEILSRSITSNVIQKLAADPALANWVATGLNLHKGDASPRTCHFCGQPLTDERISLLEGHFNDEFNKFQAEIAQEKRNVQIAITELHSAHPSDARLLYEHLREEYSKSATTFSLHRANVIAYLDALQGALDEKSKNPFRSLDLIPFVGASASKDSGTGILHAIFSTIASGSALLGAVVGKDAMEKVNACIDSHNSRTDNFRADVEKAMKTLESSYLEEWREALQKMKLTIKQQGDAAAELAANIKTLESSINELDAQIRQHHRPASELTAETRSYLGRDEISFRSSDHGYIISRNGEPALNLSEGERTAIALLYFLKSLRDTSFDLKSGIVVIDDPVSSLDSNALYHAFGYLQDRTRDAGQLFILTHNFAFFRLVKNWFNKQPGQNKKDIAQRPARFYMLSENRTTVKRRASLETLDPLLHEFESEYHYLFKCVYDEANRPIENTPLGQRYGIPNIARRLLESFLAFRVPGKANELYQQLEQIDFDSATKTRILRFLHTQSHHGHVAEPEHDLSTLSESTAVMQDVLAMMRTADPGHYNGMIQLVAPAPAAAAPAS
jgi:wobble nucleotide-excising tRNase